MKGFFHLDSSVRPPGTDNVNGMACTGGVWLRRSASLGLGNGRTMLEAKPDEFKIVYTSFQCYFLSGFALIQWGEDVILSLLGDGLHQQSRPVGFRRFLRFRESGPSELAKPFLSRGRLLGRS